MRKILMNSLSLSQSRGLLFVLFLSVFIVPLWSMKVLAQEVVTGVVTSPDGVPLVGVSVVALGTSTGTSTDFDGNYSIQLTTNNSVLEFSYIGMKTKKITVGERRVLNVQLEEDMGALDEVVVVGFGTQKKESMVSSITTIDPEELKVPSSNLTTALSGRVAGMIAYQRSGEPGLDNAEFFIRGVTTFGYKVDPLILIDNVEVTTTDLARLVPDDIASFSILKDATATAIYGARGANGVILITTKQGKEGPAKLNFRYETSVSAPIREVELADAVTYMRLHREATSTRDPLADQAYSLSKIEGTIAGTDPYLYPSVDWRDDLINDVTINQRINMSISGGGKIARYMVSGAFNHDSGILKVPKENDFNNNISLKTYSLRSNVNIDLSSTTEMIVRLNGSFDDYIGPLSGGQQVYRNIMRTSPARFAPFYPKGTDQRYINHILFGNDGTGDYLNPYADLVKGYREYSRSRMLAQLELKQDLGFITEGLNFRGLINTTRNSFFDVRREYIPFYYKMLGTDFFTGEYVYETLNKEEGREYLDYNRGGTEVGTTTYMEAALNYERTFNKKHTLSGLLVYILRNRLSNQGSTLQESLPFRNLGLSGRATYGYDNRYFAEFNFGYNGSERFHKDNRFGFFPSVGAAWSVSNESFWEPVKPYIDKLKVRGSYGIVGNDAVGGNNDRFQYISEVNMNNSGRGFTFGTDRGNYKSGITVNRYPNPSITWEKAYKSNLALELGFFNKVDITAEVFKEHRKNIFMRRGDVPATMGLSASIFANIGEATSEGVDIQFNYDHAFGNGLWIQGMGNFTYATSEFKVYEEPVYANEPWKSRVGLSLRQQWGYIAERLFIDDEEVLNSPEQIFGNQIDVARGGDIKYFDVNNDGRITELDQVPIGYPTTPEIIYGFGLSSGYKGFDFSVFFQGSARSSFWIDPSATSPFASYQYNNSDNSGKVLENQLLQVYADSHWSEDNKDLYALWPRLSTTHVINNEQRSTWFMRDGQFLRLKQLEFGYSIPENAIEKIGLKSLRFYANGTNLLTFSKFKLWDVEMAGNGLGYPIQRVINFGVNASL
ncbi:TonB-dependent receptor [Zhouia spongiae]|uniref:TonB-dependent receptor n=1 Tax=Zhouia spongiae TaxID=2202721 RepID=A0ABY3YIQ8_9FLAO|nr:TonB-dependent receptor [Zhouia spongiae]UNY97483.1 TonB-dependent receptor [Zhouia spongiae]